MRASFPTTGKLCPRPSLHQLHGQGNQTENGVNIMAQSRRNRLDDDRARRWLKKHAPKPTPKPKPERQPLEQWQIRWQEQRQERRALRKPPLGGERGSALKTRPER